MSIEEEEWIKCLVQYLLIPFLVSFPPNFHLLRWLLLVFIFWILPVFFKLIYILLKDNCFTEFCCFLSNINMNQPYVYIYSLPFETLSHLPPHPTPVGWHRAPLWVSWVIQQIQLAICFTYGNVSFHVTLSIHLTLSSSLHMSISLFTRSVSPLMPWK